MKLVTFSDANGTRVGILDSAGLSIIDLARETTRLPTTMLGLTEMEGATEILREVEQGASRKRNLDEVVLNAPFPTPARNILCVGKNYHDHAKEFNKSGFDAGASVDPIPEFPIIFTKSPQAVIGPGGAIDSTLDPTGTVDYEGELCVVIGRGGRGIASERAYQHVFGYTIVNDVTSRKLQSQHKQWFLGKSVDTFCPMGPCVVTVDEIPDPGLLHMRTHVNGEIRQDAFVSQLIFDIPFLIQTISRSMTLVPGDLIATGTCAGVGIGFSPPRFLRSGDVVVVNIEPIGSLVTPVV